MSARAHRTLDGRKDFVDEFDSLCDCCWRGLADVSADHVAGGLMRSLDDSVRLRILRSDGYWFDPFCIERGKEIGLEFSSLIEDAARRSRIAGLPAQAQFVGGMLSGVVVDSNDFKEGGAGGCS